MRIPFGISIAISGLIYQTNCINVPYTDMYLPVATNGFVCRSDFLTIDHLREVVKIAMESTFFKQYYQRFPRLFENTHLFNVKSDILLSWPAMSTGKFFHGKPGKIRLIINIRGQIMGTVMISSKGPNGKIDYEKCNPVRRFLEEGDDEQTFLNQNWSITRPTFAYNCGTKVIARSTVDGLMELASNNYFRRKPIVRDKLAHFEKFTGDKFYGDNLYSFPVQQSLTTKITIGAPGPFRIIFDISNSEFKGIINIENRKEKCLTIWDLSSTSSAIDYTPSSVLNLEAIQEIYWPDTCFGYRFKTKTLWLYLEFALKKWSSKLDGRNLNFPILLRDFIKLWPIRTPESHDILFNYAFAIGHNIKLTTYGVYRVNIRDGAYNKPELCLEFSHDHILHLLSILDPSTL